MMHLGECLVCMNWNKEGFDFSFSCCQAQEREACIRILKNTARKAII